MATLGRNGGEGATGADVAVALADVLRRMIEDAARLQVQEALRLQEQQFERRLQETVRLQEQEAERGLQEALRLQEQGAAAALREGVRRLERQLQERDETIRAFLDERVQGMEARIATVEERGISRDGSGEAGGQMTLDQQLQERDEAIRALLDERKQQVEARVAAVEERVTREGSGEAGGQGAVEQLEARMGALEEAVQRALATVFPRVEALVAQLEKPSPFSSTAAASALVAAASGGAATGARGHPAADDEERERRRVEILVKAARARMEKAKVKPSSEGEALCRAAKEGRLNDVRRLLDSGADVNYVSVRSGRSPLMSVVSYEGSGNSDPDVVSLLLDRGADVKMIDSFGWTALHWAAWKDSSSWCVSLLLAAGADVNARDTCGMTPLHRAVSVNNVAAVQELLAFGARKNLRAWSGGWKNKTPLDTAKTEVIRRLLS